MPTTVREADLSLIDVVCVRCLMLYLSKFAWVEASNYTWSIPDIHYYCLDFGWVVIAVAVVPEHYSGS